ncbi:MAG TPA: BolA/IbaG family iron-sulfur metabolism protein [Gammaproteobacteria bacterium]|nr:BolA/IbaG family iron-sulfur metabolism protein [Gammaproteobacteria bacterium]
MDCQTIQKRIEQALPESKAIVQSNDNVHFEATVYYTGFEGHSRINQHRMVYQALGDDMGRAIHALVLVTKVKKED